MDKFYAKTTEEYFEEIERRHKLYKDYCKISGELWDKFEKDKSFYSEFKEAFRKLDPAFMDYADGVCFAKINEDEL